MQPAKTPVDSVRYDWSIADIRAVYDLPINELIYQAQTVHRQYFDANSVQLCTLLSIKTGGCPENCAYCPQSAHYTTGVAKEKLLEIETVLQAARTAQANGSTRFCLGAAWRHVRDGQEFNQVLDMVRGIARLGLEVCCTLGMLNANQANQLKEAGLTAYNHNLDTGPEYYENIVSTRIYAERLQTLQHIRDAEISVCCGGILGMGESIDDRLSLLQVLTQQQPHPESVPINALVPVPGTPLAAAPPVEPIEFVRLVATARIVLPKSRVRLSAGRGSMSDEYQTLCFLAGANSIHTGEKLLTTPTHNHDTDHALLNKLGMQPMALT